WSGSKVVAGLQRLRVNPEKPHERRGDDERADERRSGLPPGVAPVRRPDTAVHAREVPDVMSALQSIEISALSEDPPPEFSIASPGATQWPQTSGGSAPA